MSERRSVATVMAAHYRRQAAGLSAEQLSHCVPREKLKLTEIGGGAIPYKILYSLIKNRPSDGSTISPILAAEKLAPFRNIKEIKQILVEVGKRAKERAATGEPRWNPESRETADHSIPYVVAATLMDGTVTLRTFNDAHLWNRELRALVHKVEVVVNDEFTRAYEKPPVEHRTRITVVTNSGDRLVAASGGGDDDLSAQKQTRR